MTRRDSWEGIKLKRGTALKDATCHALGCPHDGLHDLSPDDLVSRLSDDVLVSILSYMPIKYAAATSILLRRWRHVWCQTARLDFEDKERLNKPRSQLHAKRIKYINWVNRIIRAIDKWTEFAISKAFQRLELDLEGGFYSNVNYVFPDKIFASKCELSLKRSSNFNIPVKPKATVMEVKFLKALILKCVDVNDECLKKILTNCPVLEHLSICHSRNLTKAKVHGKALALKDLEIISCDRLIISFSCTKFNMQVSMLPKLLKLKQLIIAANDGNLFELASMVEACPNFQRFKVKSCQLTLLQLIRNLIKYGLINKEVKQPHQHLETALMRETEPLNWLYFIENSVALKKLVIKPSWQELGPTTKLAGENNATRYRAQLEPKTTPVGVELVIIDYT
ncbi:hypothetical protein OSB04_028321, partial [Centaurea solstitialis]